MLPRSRLRGSIEDPRPEMPPMAFLDPGAFLVTNPTGELMTSGLPVNQ